MTRFLLLACHAFVVAAIALTLNACGPAEPQARDPEAVPVLRSPVTLMSPTTLQATLGGEDPVVINVCTSPRSGELAGTDMAVAYNRLADAADRLPIDKDARIVLYCISGGMSATAGKTLTAMGYTNLIDLAGGTRAWRRAGLPIGERTQ
ncbi:rhodanese-like domain-containing protein [Candidatus Poribacteria bacterium]|nr:rhodanese-like domain-containing protein [Candidatus Poribacteria bacterium]MBT5532400.1 rhodanese-like domain-containing protein [Candidatus Poribacteria bacterium]MBT5714517.1 rhodanese-like domain-containing protein [Candidatus Poribacteria bacterium]MBT7098530.1 rhodanese-like domain-containing protein [Candidatus Poribacteria bacterium]MBT7807885.1 rhodanese-like domain-containing protein [Candidatus Poribacteria bacterium]